MAGRSSLVKGKTAEREVIKILQPVINEVYSDIDLPTPELKRNLMQFSEGGYDIKGLHWLALEVKRCETLNVNTWWKQTLKQAGSNKEPILIYRQSRKQWQAQILASIETGFKRVLLPSTLTLESFLEYFSLRVLFHANQELRGL